MKTPSPAQLHSPVYSVGRGTRCFYIYREGSHFLKSIEDDEAAEKAVNDLAKELNNLPALRSALEEAAAFIHNLREMTTPPGRITEGSMMSPTETLKTAVRKLDDKLRQALAQSGGRTE